MPGKRLKQPAKNCCIIFSEGKKLFYTIGSQTFLTSKRLLIQSFENTVKSFAMTLLKMLQVL